MYSRIHGKPLRPSAYHYRTSDLRRKGDKFVFPSPIVPICDYKTPSYRYFNPRGNLTLLISAAVRLLSVDNLNVRPNRSLLPKIPPV